MRRIIAIVVSALVILAVSVLCGSSVIFADEEDVEVDLPERAPAAVQLQAGGDNVTPDAENDGTDNDGIDAADLSTDGAADQNAGSAADEAVTAASIDGDKGESKDGGGQDASVYFHTKITANKDTYTSGETALISIRYTIDEGAVAPDDYVIVTLPDDVIDNVHFSVSSQHFASVEDLGGGRFKLVFGENAATALSGSMSVRFTVHTEETQEGEITAGDSETVITVLGAGHGDSGTGVFEDEAIMKDGLGNDGVSFGGYDYSGDQPAQIGIFDASEDNTFTYRLFVNRKNVSMTDVTVTDTLPDGMQFAGGAGSVVCYKIDPETMSRTDTVVEPVSVTISGQKLTVELGDIDHPVEILYDVFVPAQTSVYLRNHAEITYTQDGNEYQEYQDYIAESEDYSAANGIKCVDKTEISTAPPDQWVSYTIKFWNENGFDEGTIELTDHLDPYIDFLYAD